MKKAILAIVILGLLFSAGRLIRNHFDDKEKSYRLEYDTKVSQLKAQVDHYLSKNKDLISEVKDLKIANEVHRNKRVEIKTKWRDKIIIAKTECDTNIINSLDRTYKSAELQCDSSIANLESQVFKLEEVVSNDSSIFVAKDSTIEIYSNLVLNQEKELKKEKRKKLLFQVITGAALVLSLIIAV